MVGSIKGNDGNNDTIWANDQADLIYGTSRTGGRGGNDTLNGMAATTSCSTAKTDKGNISEIAVAIDCERCRTY